jgi:hypothetical protein
LTAVKGKHQDCRHQTSGRGGFTTYRLVALAVLLLSGAALRAADPPTRLNVIVILADDFGWTDLACYGSDLHETSHLHRLAKGGKKITQSYSACTVCSPTRGAADGQVPRRDPLESPLSDRRLTL